MTDTTNSEQQRRIERAAETMRATLSAHAHSFDGMPAAAAILALSAVIRDLYPAAVTAETVALLAVADARRDPWVSAETVAALTTPTSAPRAARARGWVVVEAVSAAVLGMSSGFFLGVLAVIAVLGLAGRPVGSLTVADAAAAGVVAMSLGVVAFVATRFAHRRRVVRR